MPIDRIFSHLNCDDDGVWTAQQGQFTLKSALQPIFRQRLDGTLHHIGSEGLLRPYIDNIPMSPAHFFASAELAFVEKVDSLSRMIHVLNHGTFAASDDRIIFINFHAASLQNPNHIIRELEHLSLCAQEVDLPSEQVICQISAQNQPHPERLSFFADSVRNRKFRLAISHIDDRAFALPNVFALRPHYIKMTAEWLSLAMATQSANHLLKRIIERCAVLNIEPILTGIEDNQQLSHCRQLHPVHLQGHRLAKPILVKADAFHDDPQLLAPAPIARMKSDRRSGKKLFADAFAPLHLTLKRRAQQFGKRHLTT